MSVYRPPGFFDLLAKRGDGGLRADFPRFEGSCFVNVGPGFISVHNPNPFRGYGRIIKKIRTVCRNKHLADSTRFEKAVAKLTFILDCHLVAGDFDYFLKIRVGDMADFNRVHGDQLIALPGVRQTRTFFVMKEVVDNAPLDF